MQDISLTFLGDSSTRVEDGGDPGGVSRVNRSLISHNMTDIRSKEVCRRDSIYSHNTKFAAFLSIDGIPFD